MASPNHAAASQGRVGTTLELRGLTPPVAASQAVTQAGWVSDYTLSCASPKAAIVMIGGFRECGPFHFQYLAPLLHAKGIHVSVTSLSEHDGAPLISRHFSFQNVMTKAVHDTQAVVEAVPEPVPLLFMGFSVGALVALHLSQRFNFRPVAGVITEGAYLKGASKIRALYQWYVSLKARKLPREEWDLFAKSPLAYASTPVDDRFSSPEWRSRPRVPVIERGALIGIEQLRVETRRLLHARKVQCPVFLAHGRYDQSALPMGSHLIKDSLSHSFYPAEVCEFPLSAHSIALGPQRDAFNEWAQSSVEYLLNRFKS